MGHPQTPDQNGVENSQSGRAVEIREGDQRGADPCGGQESGATPLQRQPTKRQRERQQTKAEAAAANHAAPRERLITHTRKYTPAIPIE